MKSEQYGYFMHFVYIMIVIITYYLNAELCELEKPHKKSVFAVGFVDSNSEIQRTSKVRRNFKN